MIEPLLPDPPPVRCRRCHHPVTKGRLYDGYGEECARQLGLLPPHIPMPRSEQPDGPTLLDLLDTAEDQAGGPAR
ncbi:hypothetical protein [Micromonospora sp. NBRC 101691]|uniref:hypothetical protein n=1 Tax=Micromonospora TaxID=1873 RepID=UPI0024A33D47|nr:hypothetical protein [Micromonospora sp. NBRC 101691]GLY20481.1 hypothetical protein Misp04_02130 [Micromonospora sp. NBRC 101691]